MSLLASISSRLAAAVNENIPPLTLPDGTEPESIEQLRENADKNRLTAAFRSGALAKWLNDMYYEAEAQRVGAISDKGDEELFTELSEAIGLPDETKKAAHEAAVQRLSEYTKDPELQKLAEYAAYSQKELVELLKKGAKAVVLVKGSFRLTRDFTGVSYHVVEGAKYELPCTYEELAEKHIFICGGDCPNKNLELISDFSVDAYQPYIFLKERMGGLWKSFASESEAREKLHGFAEKAYREAQNVFNTGAQSCISRELAGYYEEQLGKVLKKRSEKLCQMCTGEKAGLLERLESLCRCAEVLKQAIDEELNDGDYYRLYDMNYFEEQADIVELEGSRCVKGLFGERYESAYRIHNTDKITGELQKDVDGYVKTAANFAYSKYLSEVHQPIIAVLREISK